MNICDCYYFLRQIHILKLTLYSKFLKTYLITGVAEQCHALYQPTAAYRDGKISLNPCLLTTSHSMPSNNATSPLNNLTGLTDSPNLALSQTDHRNNLNIDIDLQYDSINQVSVMNNANIGVSYLNCVILIIHKSISKTTKKTSPLKKLHQILHFFMMLIGLEGHTICQIIRKKINCYLIGQILYNLNLHSAQRKGLVCHRHNLPCHPI